VKSPALVLRQNAKLKEDLRPLVKKKGANVAPVAKPETVLPEARDSTVTTASREVRLSYYNTNQFSTEIGSRTPIETEAGEGFRSKHQNLAHQF
jgi:hypothetical protein